MKKVSPIKIDFVKMSGAGNDFVLIDERVKELPITDWESCARALCNRPNGVGADGLILISKSSGEVPYTMKFYNPDGSYGAMCGNGGRCVGHYLLSGTALDKIDFEVLGSTYTAARVKGEISLSMKNPRSIRTNMKIQTGGAELALHYVDTGADHAVVFTKDLSPALTSWIRDEGIHTIGKSIRFHPAFAPGGVNVNFVELMGANNIRMRTYERGVEGETMACGTGAVASAVIASLNEGLTSPVNVKTSGGEGLSVAFERSGRDISNVRLIGPARFIFHGSITYNPATGFIE